MTLSPPPTMPILPLAPPALASFVLVSMGDALTGALVAGGFTVVNTVVLIYLPRILERRDARRRRPRDTRRGRARKKRKDDSA